MFVGHLYVFFGKMSIQFLSSFLIGQVVLLLLLSCMSSLCILDINPLLDMEFANILSYSVGCVGDFCLSTLVCTKVYTNALSLLVGFVQRQVLNALEESSFC